MRLHRTNDKGLGPTYYTAITKRYHLTMRVGVEDMPLFSERNKIHTWIYLFGRRLSFRIVKHLHK